MRRILVILTIILSSCASSRPKYMAQQGPVRPPMENKKQKAIMQLHICALVMTAWILFALDEDSK